MLNRPARPGSELLLLAGTAGNARSAAAATKLQPMANQHPPTAPYHHQSHPLQHLQHQQAPPHLQAHHQQTDRPMPGHFARRDSPGAAPQPPHIQQGPPPPPQAPRQPSPNQATSPSSKGIMSLSALIDHKSGPSSSDPRGNNIDNSMLGRLNGRR
ncbi:hypothetical protein MCOR02_000402 [Pyricularia oryzae]|nr:hypothetical protein MCOR02_000402 [Pyricularia oryzae]